MNFCFEFRRHLQAGCFWSWMNAAHDSFGQRQVVVLNLDETNIAKAYSGIKGTVALPSAWDECGSLELSEHVAKAKTRSYITYCAIIASNALISERLPQVLVASRKLMSRALEQYADIMLGARTHLWIRDSSWLNQEVFLEIMDLMLDALEPYHDFFDFILVFDASRIHLSHDIAQKLEAAAVRVVVVPAKLTWLLQPLDTHIFGNFKNNIRKKLQAATLAAPAGVLHDRQWIECVAESINEMTPQDHFHAFHRNGMLGNQNNVKPVESNVLSAECLTTVHREPPTLEEVKYCLSLKEAPWYDQVVGSLQRSIEWETQFASQGRTTIAITLNNSQQLDAD